MANCNLCGRNQKSKGEEKKFSFHRYPKCTEILEKWIEFSRHYDENRSILVTAKSVACSAHFTADSFYANIKRSRLKPTAVPSIFIQHVRFGKLGNPETIKDVLSNRKPNENIAENIKCNSSSISNSLIVKSGMDGSKNLELSNCEGEISNISDNLVSTMSMNELSKKVNRKFIVEASVIKDDDSPKTRFLKQGISILMFETDSKSKKIKILNQTIRRKKKKIASLKDIISKFQDPNLKNKDKPKTGKKKELCEPLIPSDHQRIVDCEQRVVCSKPRQSDTTGNLGLELSGVE